MNQQDNAQTKATAPSVIVTTPKHSGTEDLNKYRDGKKDGTWREYHENGQIKSEGSYTEGLKEGLHREWGDNEILLLEGYYAKGKANGLMKWFHERGHLAGEGNMVDGIRFGPWKICDIQENGFCIDAHFKNGKRDGVWKIYHENARDRLWKEQTFKEDKMVSEKCWDENGERVDCK
ncbi:MAG: toxin-antitoxin system YwqK family antitoxin [Lewinella sp.]